MLRKEARLAGMAKDGHSNEARPWMGRAEWCHKATKDEGSHAVTIRRGALSFR